MDIITFGAPCQDLSVAGKRAGMKHEDAGDDETTRSGLFYEAIRIIKEMREHDRGSGRTGELIRPRYAVYENVPGAFSSNKGADFQAVLSALCRVVEPDAPDIPLPGKGGVEPQRRILWRGSRRTALFRCLENARCAVSRRPATEKKNLCFG